MFSTLLRVLSARLIEKARLSEISATLGDSSPSFAQQHEMPLHLQLLVSSIAPANLLFLAAY